MKKIIRKKTLAFSGLILLFISLSNVAYADKLILSGWNIEWLSQHSYPQLSKVQRSAEDFSTLSQYFSRIKPDLLAFQEVDDIQAIQQVVGTQYSIVLSERSHLSNTSRQFSDINQYTGFAVRKDLQLIEHPDLNLNTKRNGKLRFATYIEVKSASSSVHLLSIHLKAGCIGKKHNNYSCNLLQAQAKKLNQWIAQREAQDQSYALLGDFNHNLAYRGDWLWKTLTKNTQHAVLATKNTQANCVIRSNRNPKQTHQFKSLIDHVVVSEDLTFSKPKQTVFSKHDVLNYRLSDHCPVSFSLSL
ncbi:hydrolase [Vibrio sp. UCD-FRSSP16_10]|uniref:endonuclease/exonuclease/phosphatase family protein n=1 Tax=unclassified Vibrio TaxID=2614977 RepID=UPI0007FD8643|nr:MULTISPECIES: endonuclease/exonuclease/phosphatase family protein [unclassified Vibrio]OBT07967.1 hydrolase [Vibrio sp. UCD-FRSSP16_30]OBT17142.1 hydrolase [Vibrio sp. UCD-FRSSP16_10]